LFCNKPTILKFLVVCLLFSQNCIAEDHWATGGWNCRHWGAIRLFEEPFKFATDLDPEGFLQNYGVWQDYDQNSVIIVWESGKREIIAKEGNKYYNQTAYSFGISSNIEEISKIITKDAE
jgi:hypothetical protein